MVDIEDLVQHLKEQRASDLHVKAGSRPYVRVNGTLSATSLPEMSADEVEKLARSIVPDIRISELEDNGETDFATSLPNIGRFRTSIVRQRGSYSLVIRRVVTAPPSFATLGLPASIAELVSRSHGLILVTGPPDSGKSTTIASLVNHVNESSAVSIVSLEDPIEMLHPDKKAFISQREVGTDTLNYGAGLSQSLRHDADVIYLDRVPDTRVMAQVLAAASSRLVITTLPTLTAAHTIQTVVDFFPTSQARQIRQQFSSVLAGIISQRLLKRADQAGRVAAFEILTMTPRINEAIAESAPDPELESHIAAGDYYGMQTLDQHLISLQSRRLISAADAIGNATHPKEVRLGVENP